MPNSPVSVAPLPDVGHYVPFEIPARFADMTEAYLRDVVIPADGYPKDGR